MHFYLQINITGPNLHDYLTGDRPGELDNYSEDDEESFSSEPDANDEHVQAFYDEYGIRLQPKKSRRTSGCDFNRQPNLKQKVVALLRKFRVPDESLELDDDHRGVPKNCEEDEEEEEEEEEEDLNMLYDSLQLDNPSDSGPDFDSCSISSTPKPTLKRFFQEVSNNSSSQAQPGSPACQSEDKNQPACSGRVA
uniref:Uncharacterized protein n=1 Tax=Eptatretus burgeri TaxID=7764 RepID=A0A8C4N3Y5_EPTBU